MNFAITRRGVELLLIARLLSSAGMSVPWCVQYGQLFWKV